MCTHFSFGPKLPILKFLPQRRKKSVTIFLCGPKFISGINLNFHRYPIKDQLFTASVYYNNTVPNFRKPKLIFRLHLNFPRCGIKHQFFMVFLHYKNRVSILRGINTNLSGTFNLSPSCNTTPASYAFRPL